MEVHCQILKFFLIKFLIPSFFSSQELSKDVILHWLNRMEPSGWIPREQILGPEPRTRVPAEFVPQTPNHANPPTLAEAALHEPRLPIIKQGGHGRARAKVSDGGGGRPRATLQIQNFALHNEDGRHTAFLERVWPYLERWFEWFRPGQGEGD